MYNCTLYIPETSTRKSNNVFQFFVTFFVLTGCFFYPTFFYYYDVGIITIFFLQFFNRETYFRMSQLDIKWKSLRLGHLGSWVEDNFQSIGRNACTEIKKNQILQPSWPALVEQSLGVGRDTGSVQFGSHMERGVNNFILLKNLELEFGFDIIKDIPTYLTHIIYNIRKTFSF